MKNEKPTDIACDVKDLALLSAMGKHLVPCRVCSKAVYVIRKMSLNDLLPTLQIIFHKKAV